MTTQTVEARFITAVETGSTRKQLAVIYAEALRDGQEHDWRAMNHAVLTRFSMSGLSQIKKWAWGENVS